MSGFWRKCRVWLRWFRWFLWLAVALALLGLAWVNVVGVPDFVRTRVISSLQERGVELEFSRMRWRFVRGIVVDNVIIGNKELHPQKPLVTAGQLQLRVDYAALLQRKLQLSGVALRDGIVTLPLTATNRLALLNVQGELRFLPEQTWALDDLRADFHGLKLRLAGEVAHAPEVLKWPVFSAPRSPHAGARESAPARAGTGSGSPLEKFTATLAKIRFSAPPQISLQVEGDGREVHSFTVRLNANVPPITTPWFSARELQLGANLSVPTNTPSAADPALGFWTNALPYRAAWVARAAGLAITNFSAEAVECLGQWSAGHLKLSRLAVDFGEGQSALAAELDVAKRQLTFTNDSAFDPRQLRRLLPPPVQAQLADLYWTQPPALSLSGAVTLPDWTNRAPDWRAASRAGRLEGKLAVTNAVVRGRTLDLAQLEFSYAQELWRLPRLRLEQGDTRLTADAEASTATGNFRAHLGGDLDFSTARPFVPTNLLRVIDVYFKPKAPANLALTAAGNWRRWDNFNAQGAVALTNFFSREQSFDSLVLNLDYTNRVLALRQVEAWRAAGREHLTADAVRLDFARQLIYFENGFSTAEVMAIVRCIGPKTAAHVEPYQFLAAPTVRINGQLPLKQLNRGPDFDGTDMNFEIVRGTPFRWTKLNSTNITGTVRWLGQYLVLTNVAGEFYGGAARGGAFFDFRPSYGCDFRFDVVVTNCDARRLGLDIAQNTNNLVEGLLSGNAAISGGETWRTWNGTGQLRLQNGLLWNVPIFGLFSPVLNTVAPGLGNSRATDAWADFVMTNGVARTGLLQIQSGTMRLQYVGTVDLQWQVEARATAQLMRNTPVIGSVVSAVLWPVSKVFECQVDGEVFAPRVTPIYFPFSRYLLNPMRTLEQMLPVKPKG